MQLVPAVFLDKDGTVVEDVPYNVDPARLRFTRGAIDGLRLVAEHGFPLVLVSNQSGIARGYFDEAALMRLQTLWSACCSPAGCAWRASITARTGRMRNAPVASRPPGCCTTRRLRSASIWPVRG